MKKILLILFCMFFMNIVGHAQNVDVTYKENCPVMVPTAKTLKTLCKLSSNEFSSIMNKHGYQEDKEFSTHKSIAYTNGNLDPIMLNCFNTYYYNILNNSIECMIAVDMVYPANAITNLVNSIKDTYITTTSDGYDIFRDSECVIGIRADVKYYRIVVKSR